MARVNSNWQFHLGGIVPGVLISCVAGTEQYCLLKLSCSFFPSGPPVNGREDSLFSVLYPEDAIWGTSMIDLVLSHILKTLESWWIE